MVAVIEFLAANWLWIALLAAIFVMSRGHGGCGMHGHGHHQDRSQNDPEHAGNSVDGRSTS